MYNSIIDLTVNIGKELNLGFMLWDITCCIGNYPDNADNTFVAHNLFQNFQLGLRNLMGRCLPHQVLEI